MIFRRLLQGAQFHGAARLADTNHRYFWLVAHTLLFGCAVAVVEVTVSRFFSNPTYLLKLSTVQRTKTFPTVLLCPEISFTHHKIDQFMDKIDYPQETNKTYIRSIMPQLAAYYSQDVAFKLEPLEQLSSLLDYNGLDLETAGLMLMPTCDDILIKCAYKANKRKCSSLFEMEVTNYGFCCVFNGNSLRRELTDPKYKPKPLETMDISNIGRYFGLHFAVSQNNSSPPVNVNSYKWINVRNPGNSYIDVAGEGVSLPPRIEVWAGFSTENMQLSDEARKLSPELRRCYLTDEALRYFPKYDRRSCLLECEMRAVGERCGCALHYHPPALKLPVCSPRQLHCAREAAVGYDVQQCDCPLACDNEKQITKHFTFLLEPGLPTYDPFYDDLDLTKVTIVRVYLNGYSKTVFARRSYFSRTDLFAQLGGVFNVFFGCSVLTTLELLMMVVRFVRERLEPPPWPFVH